MATINFRNAKILIDGASMAASFTDGPTVDVSVEMLDETAHGDDTRINKGGLGTVTISGSGNCEFGTGEIADVLWTRVGVDGTVLAIFADGITEGTNLQRGYALLGVIEEFTLGGSVGALLPFSFSAQSRGVVA